MSKIKEELVKYGIKLAQAGLVAGAGGNISAREENTVWMKPSGFAMDEMTLNDLCGIDLETGAQVQGTNKPTSEVNMHLAIYKVRPDITVVFHTHSPWASGVVSASVELRPMFAEFVNDLGRVTTVPYTTPTTQKLANVIAEAARRHETIFMVNHGVLGIGVRIKQAYFRCVVSEDAAKSFVAASIVGKPQFLTRKQVEEILSLDTVKYRTLMMETEQP